MSWGCPKGVAGRTEEPAARQTGPGILGMVLSSFHVPAL